MCIRKIVVKFFNSSIIYLLHIYIHYLLFIHIFQLYPNAINFAFV